MGNRFLVMLAQSVFACVCFIALFTLERFLAFVLVHVYMIVLFYVEFGITKVTGEACFDMGPLMMVSLSLMKTCFGSGCNLTFTAGNRTRP